MVRSKGNYRPSLVLAWLGTVGTALWVALGLWTSAGIERGLAWIGSILSPTEPVGTLDLMEFYAKQLMVILEHESLLNDAVAVMLVHTAKKHGISINS